MGKQINKQKPIGNNAEKSSCWNGGMLKRSEGTRRGEKGDISLHTCMTLLSKGIDTISFSNVHFHHIKEQMKSVRRCYVTHKVELFDGRLQGVCWKSLD